MHLLKNILIILILLLFATKVNSSIYIVDNYSFTTSIKKIKNNRNKVIEEIKKKSLNDILKAITIESDFNNINEVGNYQEFIKFFIVKDEFKKNNSYEIVCKIEFDQFRIDQLLKTKNIKYINYRSNPILTIIIDKKNGKLDLWSNDRYEKEWMKDSNNLINIFAPNADLSDINLLKEIEINSYQTSRLNKFTENYGVRDFVFVLFDYDAINKKENVFVKYQFNELKFTNKYGLNNFNTIEIGDFFKKLMLNLNNSWKEIQILSPLKNNNIVFNYDLKNLSDYIEIQKVIKKNKNIISFNDVEITKNKYSAKILFSGSYENLNDSMLRLGFIFKQNNGILYLRKND